MVEDPDLEAGRRAAERLRRKHEAEFCVMRLYGYRCDVEILLDYIARLEAEAQK